MTAPAITESDAESDAELEYGTGRFYAWQCKHGPFGIDISIELFLSIYRFAARDTLRSTSILSPQFESFRRYVDFVLSPDQ